MMYFPRSAVLLPVLASFALADVQFLTPAGGSSYAGGDTLSITWQDSGASPPLSSLTNYVISLCAGGNDAGTFQCTLGVVVPSGAFSTGALASGVINAAWGDDETNGYFLQIVSTSTTGEQVVNYSPRFSLTTMTGALPASLSAAITALPAGTTTGPATSTSDTNADTTTDTATSADIYSNSYIVPFALQTGPTRFAPMQPVPGTKITATGGPVMQFPTTSVSLATTLLPIPTQWQTTLTQTQTWSVSSIENPASAASYPSDPMAKWLARWRD